MGLELSFYLLFLCSLCNTKATSKQTLLLHAEGKKHRAKARAFHAANKQPEQAEKSTTNAVASPESNQKDEMPTNLNIEQQKEKDPPVVDSMHGSEANNGSLLSKKRKLEASENDSTRDVAGGSVPGELGNGEVIQIERTEKQKSKHQDKKAKHSATEEHKVVEDSSTKEGSKKEIKWKKLIKSALKSVCTTSYLLLHLIMHADISKICNILSLIALSCGAESRQSSKIEETEKTCSGLSKRDWFHRG